MMELASRCRSLLVPVTLTPKGDRACLTEDSKTAVGVGMRIARSFTGDVTLACVYPGEASEPGAEAGFLFATHRALAEIQKYGSRFGVPCETKILFGSPWEEIVTCASGRGHDLIVMGTNKQRGSFALVGRTASRVMRTCSIPVLIARRGRLRKRGAMIAVDLSASSDQVMRRGCEVARWRRGDLHVVHASVDRKKLPQLRAELEVRLARAVDRSGLPRAIQTHVHHGGAGEVIWDCAARERVGLVVTGMMGRTGTEKLLRTPSPRISEMGLPCPLLTVPAV